MDQPLVVLHVSLQPTVPASMQQVENDESTSLSSSNNIATFYSISNLQEGLAGVGLGEYLIKEAVQRLQQEQPNFEFVTLSPLPRFRKWLEERVVHHDGQFDFDWQELARELHCPEQDALSTLVHVLDTRQQEFVDNTMVQDIMTRLAAHYVVKEKHRRKPLDGVARFHVGNGAQVDRVNWAADLSRKGWHNSFGIMVNYRYYTDNLMENQARYQMEYTIPVSEQVEKLLQ
jgi:malonyl-CoA decarboxylase